MEKFKEVLKKTTAMLMIAVLLLGVAPLGSLTDVEWSEFGITANAARSGYYSYYVSNGKATIDYVSTDISGNVTIPSTIDGYPVVSIAQCAFMNCENITRITIPDSVTSIGGAAFEDCENLTYISIPDSVTSIGDWAFAGCISLISITIPDSVTAISSYTFHGCTDLASVTIGKNIKSIGTYAFGVCASLTRITIPDSVTIIYGDAFSSCENLKEVIIGNGVTEIWEDAFAYCESLETIRIPKSVKQIHLFAFQNCNSLTDVYYTGTQSQWNNISIGSVNSCLTNATIHYNLYSSVTREPTCTTAGVLTYTCSCGHSFTESIPALGHNYNIVYIDTPPTCNWQGSETHECGACGDSYKVAIGRLSHSYSTSYTIDTPPTCTTKGYKSRHCVYEGCDFIINRTSIPATGHSETIIPAVKSTCTETGLTAGTMCSVCEVVLTEQKVTELAPHSFTNYISNNDANCVADGTKTAKCDNCDATETITDDGSKLPHKFVEYVDDNNATCISDATKTAKCEDCIATDVVIIIGTKLPHQLSDWETTQAPDCIEAGEEIRECANCDYYETNILGATGHSEETLNAVPATCTSTGLSEGTKCSVCDVILEAQELVDMLPHEMGDWETTIEPACTETGEEKRECVNCDYYETNILGATGHSKETLNAVPATCTSTGLSEGTKCSVCDVILEVQELVDMLPHEMGDWETTIEPVCKETGKEKRNCVDCDYHETNILEAKGHSEEILLAVAATCTSTGTKVYKCTVCKTVIKTETIKATGHKETTLKAVSPTYTSTGLTAGMKCSVCGTVTVKQTTIPKLTLSKVSGLKAKTVKVAKSSEITLTWNKVNGAEKYEVYQYVSKKWKKIKTTTSNSYTVKKLKSNKSYKFRVRAVVDDIKGKYSSTLTVKTVPETASKLTLKAGKKQLTVSWKSVSSISGYEVQYSTSKKFTKKTTKTVNVKKSAKKTTIKKLKKSKKYYVRLRTYKTVDGKKIYSSWSTVKNVKVK